MASACSSAIRQRRNMEEVAHGLGYGSYGRHDKRSSSLTVAAPIRPEFPLSTGSPSARRGGCHGGDRRWGMHGQNKGITMPSITPSRRMYGRRAANSSTGLVDKGDAAHVQEDGRPATEERPGSAQPEFGVVAKFQPVGTPRSRLAAHQRERRRVTESGGEFRFGTTTMATTTGERWERPQHTNMDNGGGRRRTDAVTAAAD